MMRAVASIFLVCCLAGTVLADRQPGSLSTIKRSPSTGNVEVIHRLHNHDAELGIISISGERGISLEQLEGRARLALYVERQFIIAAATESGIGAPVPLELIGAEIDGEYVLVYQEYSGDLPAELAVRNDILRDVFPSQVNHVNIALGDSVRSLTFGGDDGWHTTSTEK
jgi:hypothetical protein